MAHKNTYIDYSGTKFNKITVLKEAPRSLNRPTRRRWFVKCDCGNTTTIETSSISGKRKMMSCGKCIPYYLVGKDFGWIKVIAYAFLDKKRRSHRLKCICKCGTERIIDASIIATQRYKHCKKCKPMSPSVIGNAYALKHGLTKNGGDHHPLYKLRNGIMTRCFNAKKEDYPYYQGKGIGVYKEWINDPLSFYNWAILNGWKNGLTINRIDSNKNYDPSNCEFVTLSENLKNMHKERK